MPDQPPDPVSQPVEWRAVVGTLGTGKEHDDDHRSQSVPEIGSGWGQGSDGETGDLSKNGCDLVPVSTVTTLSGSRDTESLKSLPCKHCDRIYVTEGVCLYPCNIALHIDGIHGSDLSPGVGQIFS